MKIPKTVGDVADLYEELVLLDEVYGELDTESNERTRLRRIEICKLLDKAGEDLWSK